MANTIENADDDRDDHDELDQKMVDLLVCPLTKQPLHYDELKSELVSRAASLAYPIRGGVPILLPSEARNLNDGTVPGDVPD
ncbi:MAG: Trm112 family protein [Pseudomonadota bacterium]